MPVEFVQPIHDWIRGIYLLHWLTGAVPLATLVVVGGVLRPNVAARLVLAGVIVTLASGWLYSIAPETSQIRYGAPLPMVCAGLDLASGELRTPLHLLRACFVANLLFWSSTFVLLGAIVTPLWTRRARRRDLTGRGRAVLRPRHAG